MLILRLWLWRLHNCDGHRVALLISKAGFENARFRGRDRITPTSVVRNVIILNQTKKRNMQTTHADQLIKKI